MGDRLTDYYTDLDVLCARLSDAGRVAASADLFDAKAGGATSGEILSHTGAVLHELSQTVDEEELNREIRRLSAVVDELWSS